MTVLLAPAGASLTDVTLIVIVFARRVEIDAAVGGAAVVLHLEREAGVAGAVGVGGRGEHQLAAVMSATATNWPAVTATPLSVSVPAPGSVVIFTASSVLAGVSLGSLKPKSAAVNV